MLFRSNEFSTMFKNYGTNNLIDLFNITCGNKIDYNKFNDEEKYIIEILLLYFHPL